MPKVLNMYHLKRVIPPNAIYIGRPSIWGNRYTHLESKRDQANLVYVPTREESVRLFREWVLTSEDAKAQSIRRRLTAGELTGKDVVCWCVKERDGAEWAPDRDECHGFVVLELANPELYRR